MGIGSAMAGGNPATGRQADDWYPTPVDVPAALLRTFTFSNDVHECACGDGAMSKVIETFGYNVTSTDLVDRGYGSQMDFFDLDKPLASTIITNPPFNLATEFITHALDNLQVDHLALVLKSTFWHAKSRYPLFERLKPKAVAPLLWRPDFLGQGRPTMECSWVIWERGYTGPTSYNPLARPS